MSFILKKIGFFRLSIQRQIFLALVWLSLLTALILGIVVYSVSKRTIEDQYYKAYENSLGVASEVIKLSLRSDIEQARSLLTENAFIVSLKEGNEEARTFSASRNKIIQEFLQDIISSNNEIRDILVVNAYGNISFVSQNDDNLRKVQKYYYEEEILSESFIEDASEAKGKEVFYPGNVIFDDENETFSLVKEIIDPVNYKHIGFLIMNIRKENALSGAFGRMDEAYGTDYEMIVAKDRQNENSYELVYATADISKEQFMEVTAAYYSEAENPDYLFEGRHNNLSDWDIINVISKAELGNHSKYIAMVDIVIGAILIAIALPISYMISGYITRPLYLLEENIQSLGEGNYHVDTEFDDSEPGRIGQKFKDVVNNNLELEKKLIQTELKEREAELLLMQTQINPHYLYNTLDTLYMMAIIKNEDEIAEFVQALSENFRLTLNKGNKLIMVEDEVRRIQAYMKIQSYRFRGKYSLEINMGADILRERILTFILQPLVENAVFHGLETQADKGTVTVSGELGSDDMTFIVEDDGVGIKDMTVLESGYGVRNIRERIKLFYGEEYMPVFENTGHGTRVTITVPRITTAKMMEENFGK
ncbi:sensor histidine kinase [Butyrivibrio sp. AE3006]|uniref:sensor histidine kinase n=1 Tax=Butyrivibrio sp. AE3006 TaxID=1280673 RepID=UPI0004137E2D|nr:histidine kinase [Butyrivibrio sp. AE3006]